MDKRRFLELVKTEMATHTFWEENRPADFVMEYSDLVPQSMVRRQEAVIRSMIQLGTIVTMTEEEARDKEKVEALKHLAAEKAWVEINREFGFNPTYEEIKHAAACVGIHPWKLDKAIAIIKGIV